MATDFYKELYANKTNEKLCKTTLEEDPNQEPIPYIMQSEIRRAIQTQKACKSPGDDMITNELLKLTMEEITQPFKHICNEILETD
ncbi:unnamed protein product [Euphydryas editha]|uniref:Uncharacterized protein n=1 Tax=Euphydryas editha TaxID=104508 RepID=A0AAU9URY4_EUPED|nr:unnamed protein product [Euphydryas editha]